MSEYIYVKLLKKWGGFAIGEVVRFGVNKGEGRIAKGEGVKVEKPKAAKEREIPKKEKPKVETASIKPKAETAEVTPKIEAKKKANVKKKGDMKKGRKGVNYD